MYLANPSTMATAPKNKRKAPDATNTPVEQHKRRGTSHTVEDLGICTTVEKKDKLLGTSNTVEKKDKCLETSTTGANMFNNLKTSATLKELWISLTLDNFECDEAYSDFEEKDQEKKNTSYFLYGVAMFLKQKYGQLQRTISKKLLPESFLLHATMSLVGTSFSSLTRRLFSDSGLSSSSMVFAMYYFDRIRSTYHVGVCEFHLLIIGLLCVATKFCEDEWITNKNFMRLCIGDSSHGTAIKQMNALELECLVMLKFDLLMPKDAYNIWYKKLQNIYVKSQTLAPEIQDMPTLR